MRRYYSSRSYFWPPPLCFLVVVVFISTRLLLLRATATTTTTVVADAFLLGGDNISVHHRRRPSRSSFSSKIRTSLIHRGGGNLSTNNNNKSAASVSSETASLQLQASSKNSNNNNDEKDTTTTNQSSSSSSLVLSVGTASLLATSTAAKLGALGGPYTDEQILQDVGATLLTATVGYVFVRAVSSGLFGTRKEQLDPRDSRKIIHTVSAPAFIAFWPIFSPLQGARVFAAVVPLLNAVRLYLAGTTSDEDDDSGDDSKNNISASAELARAVSRSGDKEEALGGPFIYVCILAANILLFWRSSPVGIVSLCCLAAGDGMADLIGRRYGKNNKWPGLDKSIAGTMAFWIASTVASAALLGWMQYWGCLTLPVDDVLFRVACISLITALIELVPIADDNYTVPVSAALLTMLFFQ